MAITRDSSKSLAAELKALDQLDSKTYAEFNAVLNPFDPSIPLSKLAEQDPVKAKKLVEIQNKIQEHKKFREELTKELLTGNQVTRDAFWKEYSTDQDAQQVFESFIKRMDDGVDSKTSPEALLSSKADVLNIMAFHAGVELMMKINLNLGGRELVIKEDLDYVCEMQKEQGKFFHKQGHDEAQKKKIKDFSGDNDDELKALYKKDKHTHKKGDVSELTGLNILVPKSDPSSLLLNVAKDANGQVMLSVTPPYRALFHELCHAHRDLKGANKRYFNIPDKYRALYSKSAEELWTINLGKSSEKTLSQEDGIPGRITHSGFSMFVVGSDITTNKEKEEVAHSDAQVSTSILNTRAMLGETDFSSIIYNSTEAPVVLMVEKKDGEKFDRFKADGSQIGLFITGGDWVSPSITGANVQQSFISNCNIEGASFNQTNLSNSTLSGVNIKNSDFSNADLSSLRLKMKNTFEDVSFNGADLKNIDFSKNVTFKGKIDMAGADMRGANLSGVNLTGVDLTGADLRGANLAGAILNKANMVGAKLEGANLDNTSMNFARVRQAGFTPAMHLDKMEAEKHSPINTSALNVINSLIDALSDLSDTEKSEKQERVDNSAGSKRAGAVTFLSSPLRVNKDEKSAVANAIVADLNKIKGLTSPQLESELSKVIAAGIEKNKSTHSHKPSSSTQSRLNSLLSQAQSMITSDSSNVAQKKLK
jgi:uncharacterized protein YjbI with pentapeptide repeats